MLKQVSVLLFVGIFVSGCVAKSFYATQALRDTGEPLRILLLNPNVSLYVQTAGGVLERQDQWTEAALENVRANLTDIFADRNIELVLAEDFNEIVSSDPVETELLRLHSAVGATIQENLNPQLQLPTKANDRLWSLGPDVGYLAQKYDADYAVFVQIQDSYASAGRVAAIIVVAVLFGVGMQGGTQVGYASLVDLQSGDVVWFNALARGTGDLREAEPARETVEVLLTDFPSE